MKLKILFCIVFGILLFLGGTLIFSMQLPAVFSELSLESDYSETELLLKQSDFKLINSDEDYDYWQMNSITGHFYANVSQYKDEKIKGVRSIVVGYQHPKIKILNRRRYINK